MRLGNESGVFLEGTVMKYLNASTNTAYQVNASFFFGDAPTVFVEKKPGESLDHRSRKKTHKIKKPKKDKTSVLE